MYHTPAFKTTNRVRLIKNGDWGCSRNNGNETVKFDFLQRFSLICHDQSYKLLRKLRTVPHYYDPAVTRSQISRCKFAITNTLGLE